MASSVTSKEREQRAAQALYSTGKIRPPFTLEKVQRAMGDNPNLDPAKVLQALRNMGASSAVKLAARLKGER